MWPTPSLANHNGTVQVIFYHLNLSLVNWTLRVFLKDWGLSWSNNTLGDQLSCLEVYTEDVLLFSKVHTKNGWFWAWECCCGGGFGSEFSRWSLRSSPPRCTPPPSPSPDSIYWPFHFNISGMQCWSILLMQACYYDINRLKSRKRKEGESKH